MYREFVELSGIAELVPGFDASAGADLSAEEGASEETTDLTAEEEDAMYRAFVEASGLEELLGRPVDTSADAHPDAAHAARADLSEEEPGEGLSDEEIWAAYLRATGQEEG